jgi:diaminopimelate epimerase
MISIPVVKMSGTGNDFLMVDNRKGRLKEGDLAPLTREACPRRISAGADGLILIEPARTAGHEYRMRIFNADGSEAEMCGNGSRCCAIFAAQIGAAGTQQVIETLAGTLHAEVADDGRSAKVQLSPPDTMVVREGVPVLGQNLKLHSLNTGVPHAVLFVEDVARVDVRAMGTAIRHHEVFKPKGTNANFVQPLGGNAIQLRTYERGVEDETLACGTGACASAIITALVHNYAPPIKVHVASGDVLAIHFELDRQGKTSSRPYLEGAVRTVYRGEYYWNR